MTDNPQLPPRVPPEPPQIVLTIVAQHGQPTRMNGPLNDPALMCCLLRDALNMMAHMFAQQAQAQANGQPRPTLFLPDGTPAPPSSPN